MNIGRLLLTVAYSATLTLVTANTHADPSGVSAPQSVQGTVDPKQFPRLPMSLIKAPAGAPNVVIVLLDDVGFGAASTFGGPIATPALQKLADEGLRYNRFHTAAICSPTRAALLTGRNPHAVGVGAVLNTPSAYPGYSGVMPKSAATIAEVLRQNGYGTGMFGKWHLAPEWESSPAGPYDRWPIRQGFDHFYGFLPAEVDQFAPTLVQDQTFIPTPRRDGYHVTEDLADQMVSWIQRHRSATPSRPFFAYLAPGAAHAPLQVPKPWIAKYKGRFAGGWDRLRQESFERQKQLGVIPADSKLSPRPEALPAWESLSADEKKIAQRYMETYAGFLEHTDAQIGRVIESLKDMGEFDNTIFIYIVGDNGASGEGGVTGSLRYMAKLQGVTETNEELLQRFDEIGGSSVHAHYNAGWAWALNSPFPWMKQVASHLGGTRNPMVVSWPRRIRDRGGLRDQYAFVADIAPTLLAAAGIEAPAVVNGVTQQPIDGLSLLATFDDPKAPSPRKTQYFNVYGNRAIYHDGWMASAFRGRAPWDVRKPITRSIFEDQWELYDLTRDFSQADNIAADNPAKLEELKSLFWHEAGRNQVLPLIDNQQSGGLPHLLMGQRRYVLFDGAVGIPETQSPPVMFSSHTITAKVNVGRADRGGNILSYGGVGGGWQISVGASRVPVYRYRFADNTPIELRGKLPLSAGENTIEVVFDYDKPMSGGPATVAMRVNGKDAGRLRLTQTIPYLFSIHETLDVGTDLGGLIATDSRAFDDFDGRIRQIVIDIR
ncbi:MAG: arylsulfatase [Gammaproteobacteria bacterium]|nr:arylsulfatase [Gammaproteobacteria bacterium]